MRVLDLLGGGEVMSDRDCREMLLRGVLGRLATATDGVPDIAPVNYVFDGSDILIHSNLGHKLLASSGSPVAFEIDHVDETTHSGTSVVVHGDAWVEAHAGAAETPAWSGSKDYLIRIHPRSMTGRRVARPTSR